MFQGKEEDWNYQPLDIKAKEVNALLLTHAHLDHSGRIPVLVKNGFRGPIFATPIFLLVYFVFGAFSIPYTI